MVEEGASTDFSVVKQNGGFVINYFSHNSGVESDAIKLDECSIFVQGVKNFSKADVHFIPLPDIIIDPVTINDALFSGV